MATRVYAYYFLDIEGNYQTILEEMKKSDSEWKILENKFNIGLLKKKLEAYDSMIKSLEGNGR